MPRQKPNRDGATGAIRGAKLGVSSLIAAARKGDLAKIREGIAQGLNVNAVTGGVTLTCALGGAAEKGKSEAIKLLLEAGADPNNPLLPKHSTFPLDWAVFSRSAECVRLLLEAGANANRLGWDDQTALDAAKTYNNLPMINLLKKRSTKTGGDVGRPVVTKVLPVVSADDDDSPVVNLSREANQPEFSKFLTKMAKASGVASQTRQNIRGGYSFSMPRLRADKIFDTYCQQARDAGFFLFRSTTSGSDGNHMLILLPTADSYVAVRGMQTSGANYDLMPSDIIRWLKALEKRQPFILSGIGHDFLEGRFTTELKDVNSLAKDIYKFCPDVVDQGTETVGRLAAELKRMRRLFLWWD